MAGGRVLAAFGLGAAVAAGYAGIASGAITLDVGIGRRTRRLGPLTADIAAPRELVFDLIAAPYLGRTPRAMQDKLQVWERGSDLVLAAHRTPIGGGLVATTVETVRFTRPERVDFRLVRGPVPHVVEEFLLTDTDGATRLDYHGELGTDGWAAGARWGDVVARRWEAVVRDTLTSVKTEAERRTHHAPADS
jgi:hypothetical protein